MLLFFYALPLSSAFPTSSIISSLPLQLLLIFLYFDLPPPAWFLCLVPLFHRRLLTQRPSRLPQNLPPPGTVSLQPIRDLPKRPRLSEHFLQFGKIQRMLVFSHVHLSVNGGIGGRVYWITPRCMLRPNWPSELPKWSQIAY